ncbi:MAG: Na(+)/H(+) antiporter subunit C [Actinomycetota bacterium]|nr:Na(+)/H(+) antiporter subunit C [Actinomycetota bacterium]
MTGNLTLALVTGVLYTVGTYLLLQRTLTRVVIGLTMLSHGANLLLLQSGGAAGLVPFVTPKESASVGPVADPLPQAMVLTAIVISFGVSAFLLALAYRSWLLTEQDEVQDDVEDRRVLRDAHRDEARRYAEALERRRREDEEEEQ